MNTSFNPISSLSQTCSYSFSSVEKNTESNNDLSQKFDVTPVPDQNEIKNGAILQTYNVQRNIFINITPERNGNMSVDVISPKNHEILEHHSINPMEVYPSNASYLEMLALEQHLYTQGKCEQLLSGFLGILYENEGLNERANHLEELKTSMDYFLKDNTFDSYLKNRQATYEILNWRPRKNK